MIHMGKYGDNLSAVVAQQLQAERAAMGWTYKQMAEASGVDQQSLIRYLTGKREIKTAVLGLLCDALGITPGDLLRRATERIQ